MTITFFTNFMNHHQLPLCLELHKQLGNNFKVVVTEIIPTERLKLGYSDINNEFDFIIPDYENDKNKLLAEKLAIESDIVIFGSSPNSYFNSRIALGKTTLRYSERLFKRGLLWSKIPHIIAKIRRFYPKNDNFHVLAASAFMKYDLILANANQSVFKWGYFPEVSEESQAKTKLKGCNQITHFLWVGRFLYWKRPMDAIKVVERLIINNYDVHLTMIGEGALRYKLLKYISKKKLEPHITLLNGMSPKEVRKYMEFSDVFLFTSNFKEGWGAVLNEAMSSRCAVIVNHAIGSVPFLIRHNQNGLIYRNGHLNGMYECALDLVNDKDKLILFGNRAHDTIQNQWNPIIAANRLVDLCNNLLYKSEYHSEEGPCSKAECIKNNWFKGGNKSGK